MGAAHHLLHDASNRVISEGDSDSYADYDSQLSQMSYKIKFCISSEGVKGDLPTFRSSNLLAFRSNPIEFIQRRIDLARPIFALSL